MRVFNHIRMLLEAGSKAVVKFSLLKHSTRRGVWHHDLRFVDPENTNVLLSFAIPIKYDITKDKKSILIQTDDHALKWLTKTIKNMVLIDHGKVEVEVVKSRYHYRLRFKGSNVQGQMSLIRIGSKTDSKAKTWMIIRKGS